MKKILKYLSSVAAIGLAIGGTMLTVSADEEAVVTTAATVETESTSAIVTTQLSVTSVSEVTTVPELSVTTTTVTTRVTVTKPEINENVVFGWNMIDGKWFYFNGNKFVTGVQRIGDDFYLFATNGAMRTGWQTVNTRRRYYDFETHSPVYGWVEYRGKKYYNHIKTGKLTGMHEIDGNTYIFDENGAMHVGFITVDNFMYYCNEDGIVQYGDGEKTPVLIDGYYYYISPKGYVNCGWQTVNGLRYYYDYETGLPVFQWVSYKGNMYYVDKITGKYTGKRYIGKYPYLFNEKGILCTGLQHFTPENITCYFKVDGTRAVSEIIYTDNGNYYFDENGNMQTGWITFEKNKYYFDENGKMLFGINAIDGNKYLFDETGKMCIGLGRYNNGIYYLDGEGIMRTGWHTFRGNTYYFDVYTGQARIGWFTKDGDTYYFDDNGVMATGKYTVKDNTYYFGVDGRMQIGWQTINNEKYYFSIEQATLGIMYTYRHVIDGIDYLFYSTGAMATDGNQKIVVKALSQLGIEGGQPYWTWWGFNFRIEWCACFVSWCAMQCGYTQQDQTPKFISCKVGIDWFKAHGQWMGRNYIPKSGDYIFFDWEPDAIADHIGIVDYYEDGYVYTVEGNSDDMVRTKKYSIKSENIYGFAAPDFLGGKDDTK